MFFNSQFNGKPAKEPTTANQPKCMWENAKEKYLFVPPDSW